MSNYGNMLIEARERRRATIERCARDLRVRRDILEYIENGDFRNLPSAGHAKNLVFAYSKYLGLSPALVTAVFVKEREEFMGANRRSSGNIGGPILNMEKRGDTRAPAGHNTSHESQGSRKSVDIARGGGYRSRAAAYNPSSRYEGARGRREMGRADSITPLDYNAHVNHGVPREHSIRPIPTGRSGGSRFGDSRSTTTRKPYDQKSSFRSSASGFGNMAFGSPSTLRRNPQFSSGRSSVSFLNFASSGSTNSLLSRLPIVVAVAVILILIVIILLLLLSPKENVDTSSDYISVTGADSSEISSSDVQKNPGSAPAPVLTPPTSAKVEYKNVGSGEVWIEVYIDGASSPDVAKLLPVGASESYDVTGSLEFVATIPDYIALTVDGEPVELVPGEGSYSYTVEFAEILDAWNLKYKPAPQGAEGSVSAIDALDDSLGVTGSATTSQGTPQSGENSVSAIPDNGASPISTS